MLFKCFQCFHFVEAFFIFSKICPFYSKAILYIPMKDEVFVIKGLAGKKTLKGEVSIGGAKNAVLPLFASAILFNDDVKFSNIPDIEDCLRMSEILGKVGVSVVREKKGQYILNASKAVGKNIDEEIAKKLRASIILTGPMLARFKKVSFPHPGGCVIGARPIDIFLDGYKAMGAKVTEKDSLYVIEAKNGLKGAELFLRTPSVTATEAFMMAGSFGKRYNNNQKRSNRTRDCRSCRIFDFSRGKDQRDGNFDSVY